MIKLVVVELGGEIANDCEKKVICAVDSGRNQHSTGTEQNRKSFLQGPKLTKPMYTFDRFYVYILTN